MSGQGDQIAETGTRDEGPGRGPVQHGWKTSLVTPAKQAVGFLSSSAQQPGGRRAESGW